MKIIEFRAENVKRLKAVSIKPDGNVVTISGRNGQGKSSILDAIHYALAGAAVQPPEVLRRGQETAQVVLDLGDMVVERRWTAKGTYLDVKSKDGAKYPSPGKKLESIAGALSFDPHGFLRFDKAKQLATVRELVKLDTAELDARRQAVVERRTEAKRRVDDMGRQLAATPAPAADGMIKRVDVGELLEEQKRRQESKAANDKLRAAAEQVAMHLSMCRDQVLARSREVEELEKEVAAARLRLKESQQHEQRLVAEKVAAVEKAQGLVDPDVSEVYRSIKNAEATNEAVRQLDARTKLELDLERRKEEHQLLDTEVGRIDDDKSAALKAARFPVDGLSFGADGLTWNGLPFEQASAAEQLRVSVAMAMAMNPKLRVMLVRDGSLLDSESLQLLKELTGAADYQLWIECVADDGGAGFVIEDGEVLEHEASTDAA